MNTGEHVVISDRGGGNPRRVAVVGVRASWPLNAAGSFSAFARIDDLRAAGLGGDLTGMWVEYEHAMAGRWGGILSDPPDAGGVVELAADGWAALAYFRLLREGDTPPAGSPGGLAKRVLMAAAREQATFITFGTIDEGGEDLQLTLTGDAGRDLLARIAEEGDVEWRFDADRVFHLARRLGRDLSARVRLVEDRHIIDPRLDNDTWAARRGQVYGIESREARARRETVDILGGANVPTSAINATIVSLDPSQPSTGNGVGPGLLQFLSDVPVSGASPIAPPAWLGQPAGIGANNPAVPSGRRSPAPTVPLQFTMPANDPICATFDVADTVRVELGLRGFSGRFRVKEKAIATASGELFVGGEALADD